MLEASRTFVLIRGAPSDGPGHSHHQTVACLGKRDQGGANTDKQAALSATVEVLNRARAFYIDFFLAHADKLAERVLSYSEEHLEMRERAISANELLSWAEACTVETEAHPYPSSDWNFSARFPDLPFIYRRSVIKDAIGKVRSYLSQRARWEKSGKKKGKPGCLGTRITRRSTSGEGWRGLPGPRTR